MMDLTISQGPYFSDVPECCNLLETYLEAMHVSLYKLMTNIIL